MAAAPGQRLETSPLERERWRRLFLAAVVLCVANCLLRGVWGRLSPGGLAFQLLAMGVGVAVERLVCHHWLYPAKLLRRALARRATEANIRGLSLPQEVDLGTAHERLGENFWLRALAGIGIFVAFAAVAVKSRLAEGEELLLGAGYAVAFGMAVTPRRLWTPVILSWLPLIVAVAGVYRAGPREGLVIALLLVEGVAFAVLQTRLEQIVEFAENSGGFKEKERKQPVGTFVVTVLAALLAFSLVPDRSETRRKEPVPRRSTSHGQVGQGSPEGPEERGKGKGGGKRRGGKQTKGGGGKNAGGGQGAGEQGAGEQGAGEQGAGEQGAGEQGAGEQGAGEQGAGEQGAGEQGAGEQGAGNQGAGDQGGGAQGARNGSQGGAKPGAPKQPSSSPDWSLPKFELPKIPDLDTKQLLRLLLGVSVIVLVGAGIYLLVKRRRTPDEALGEQDSVPRPASLADFQRACQRAVQVDVRSGEDLRQMVVRLYNLLLEFHARCGLPREPNATPDEFMLTSRASVPSEAREMAFVTDVFCRSHYGKTPPSETEARSFVQCVAKIGDRLTRDRPTSPSGR